MFKRKLNEFEYFTWTFGQPNNIALSVSIKGNIDENRLRRALDLVQEKHSILQSQLHVDETNAPYLVWNNIGEIPLEIIPRTEPELYKQVIDKEFSTSFETGIECSQPLIRAKLITTQSDSETISDLIITLQHIIADGMSMAFLFRDILLFYMNPERRFNTDNTLMQAEDLLPADYRKKLPKTKVKFHLIRWLMKLVLGVSKIGSFFKNIVSKKERAQSISNPKGAFKTYEWSLSKNQTERLIAASKGHGVSVHSAVCSLFVEDFPHINNPVNLRNRLDMKIKDSVGMFAGGIILNAKYRQNRSLWENAKQYQKKLKKTQKSDKVFSIFKIITRNIPLEDVEKFLPLFIEIAGKSNPLIITNLGSLDKLNLLTSSTNLEAKQIYGGVSTNFNAVILTIYTIQNKMHFNFHYYEPTHTREEIAQYASNALEKLDKAF